jgi:tripartite motif-containing protein 32
MCKICYEVYDSKGRKPVILHCGHTLCLACASKTALTNQNDVICPFDKQVTYQYPKNLATNFLILEILEKNNNEREEV